MALEAGEAALPTSAGPSPGRASDSLSLRLAWATVFAACAGLLGTAAWLDPDPAGLGTHQKLGMAACGWMTAARLPCPTCGMTTSFSLTVRGRWIAAFQAQPAGALLAWLTGLTFWLSLAGVWSGRGFSVLLNPLLRWRFAALAALVVTAAWIYKMALVRGF